MSVQQLLAAQASLAEEAQLISDLYLDTGSIRAQSQLMLIQHEMQHIENQLYLLESQF